MSREADPRVLSIQSHVVRGYVGNKSATLALQSLGVEVDPLNNLQFSNSKGYKHCQGQVLDAQQVSDIADGLEKNGFLGDYSHILTGYIGSESAGLGVEELYQKMKQRNPNLVYILDPVLGDNGRMYVSESISSVMRDRLLPLADMITPNQFELGVLADMVPESVEQCFSCMEALHHMGPRFVVVTSVDFNSGAASEDKCKNLQLLVSSSEEEPVSRFVITFPKIEAYYQGTGDLFTSLLCGWCALGGPLTTESVLKACEQSVAALQETLLITQQHPGSSPFELNVLKSRHCFSHPSSHFKAEEFLGPPADQGREDTAPME